jgi:hypothetical protein
MAVLEHFQDEGNPGFHQSKQQSSGPANVNQRS